MQYRQMFSIREMEIIKVPLLPIPLDPTPILTFPLKGKERSPLPFQGGGWEGDGLITSPSKGEEPNSLPRVPGQKFYGFKGRARVGMGLRWYDAIHKGYFRYCRLPKRLGRNRLLEQ